MATFETENDLAPCYAELERVMDAWPAVLERVKNITRARNAKYPNEKPWYASETLMVAISLGLEDMERRYVDVAEPVSKTTLED
jgi:hypothetical protein